MSSVILTNWTVYYSGDTGGDLQIRWTGTTGTNTLRQLYSALQNLFDNSTEMDDGTPMSAQTPTDYTIGLLDAGETDAWFIDPESIKHLTGGGLSTQLWKRTVGTNIGIVKLPYTVGGGSDFVAGDIGKHVDMDANDGTLLYYNSTDLECWIRPDTDTAADNFDDAGTLAVASGTGSVTIGAASDSTGEMIWSNIYTLGTIEDNTTLYVSQSNSVISNSEASGSGNWWSEGHLDILVATTDQDILVDRGLLTVYARQYSKKYNFYTVDVSSGGRTPIPLSTSDDLNNTTGYRTMSISSASGDYTVDEVIQGGTSGAEGIVTAETGSPTTSLVYYLIGDVTTDFQSSETVTGQTSSVTGTSGAPSNTGPASQSMTITFGLDQTLDVNDDSTNEDYSVVIDLASSIALTTMNERLKYVTRRGETATLDGLEGQQYIGIDYRVVYTTITGSIAEGSTVTQILADTTTATSEVVAHETTGGTKYLMLRDTRGTLETGGSSNWFGIDGSNNVTMSTGATASVVTPTQEHPFGVFAGGKFFGARGVAVKNVLAADAENYELIDNAGNRIVPPSTYPVTVTVQDVNGSAVQYAQVFIRKSGDYYNYTSDSSNDAGDADFVVNETVDTDLPQTGWLHIWDASSNTKQNYRYASWTSKTFSLKSEVTYSCTGGGSGTSLQDTGHDFTALDIEEGDTVRNTTDGSWALVDEIVDADNITTSALQGGSDNTWTSGDTYSFHRLTINYADNNDLVDIPLLNDQTNASGIVSMSYTGSVPITITVRIRSNEEATKYIPYDTSGSITSSGYSLTAVLTEDEVAT